MRTIAPAVVLLTFLAWRAPVRADSADDFLTLARNAIGTPQALAAVHSLHAMYRIRSTGRHRGLTVQLWLDPPSQFLIRAGSFSYGFDGSRLIGVNPPWMAGNAPPDRYSFLHWTMALLLYNPKALGIRMIDEGMTDLGKKQARVLEATASDSDFSMRMYFDPTSHRLLRTDGISMATPLDGWGEPVVAFEYPEQDIYGGYKRYNGIELPLTVTRNIVDGMGTMEILDVVSYQINPKDLAKELKP